MAETMTNEDWYAILKDLDIFEKDCSFGYMGAYHIDLPYILGLKPNSKEESYFYFQKARLYQEKEGIIHKGPLSLFMSNAMNGRLWAKLILSLNHQFSVCAEKIEGLLRPRYLIEYVKSGNSDTLDTLWGKVTNGFSPWNNSLIHPPMKNIHIDGYLDDLAKYLNARMDDNGWKLLIEDTFEIEAKCKNVLGNDFPRITWTFHAGVAGDPMQAYQLTKILIDMKINTHGN